MPIRRIDKTLTATTAPIAGEDIAASSIPVKPHIQPGVLQPAVAGKDLSGTALGGSYTYGTAHTDGHSYYYTDIKGSKPIKDPRIGAHFGSQRHDFRSMQLQEQETATHGLNVWKMDGREWMRAVGGSWKFQNASQGVELTTANSNPADFIEITGYFSHCNFLIYPQTNSANDVNIYIDGTDTGNDFSTRTTSASPLGGRYVNGNMLVNLNLGSTTLGLHTLKIGLSSTYMYLTGCELIAQDVSSTANKSKIQIPSQNVVSYGKKFTVSAAAHHYDPFNGFVNDTTLFSAKVDTATSLGLGTATTWGCPWDKGSDNHIRPLNGGRVVKWIASDGTIKTSVTMMPRNAQNIGNNTTNGSAGTASNEITTASATNAHTINFSDDVIDNSLSEIAKTFHYREFGNGSANGGTEASYADASMVSGTADDLSFVMDDGLTSLSANDCNDTTANFDCLRWANADNDDVWYLTFIGTGISWEGTANMASNDRRNHIYAQNLPYGTHVVKVIRTGSSAGDIIIDGVTVDQPASGADDSKLGVGWITIYQPKKPPIPQDAVIIADYMLMADFVPITTVDTTHATPSKGCRRVNASRDFFYDDNGSNSLALQHFHANTGTHTVDSGTVGSGETLFAQLPSFCTNFVSLTYQNETRHKIYLDTVNKPNGSGATQNNTGSWGSYGHLTTDATVGLHTIRFEDNTTYFNLGDVDFASPIHTSSHYQPFETPFLHELVGGDRNMEQTNLVVTPDGKTWDEVTRDTSYLGHSVCMLVSRDGGTVTSDFIFDYFRGNAQKKDHYNKGIAIAYDRFIILEDGTYEFIYHNYNHGADTATFIILNSDTGSVAHGMITRNDPGDHTVHGSRTLHLKRGDTLKVKVTAGTADGTQVGYNDFQIIKIGS